MPRPCAVAAVRSRGIGVVEFFQAVEPSRRWVRAAGWPIAAAATTAPETRAASRVVAKRGVAIIDSHGRRVGRRSSGRSERIETQAVARND